MLIMFARARGEIKSAFAVPCASVSHVPSRIAQRSGGNAKPRNAESALRGGLRGGLEPDAQFQSLRGYGRFMLPAPTVAAPVDGAALLLAFTVGCTGAAGVAVLSVAVGATAGVPNPWKGTPFQSARPQSAG
jgi:hypothetical protein